MNDSFERKNSLNFKNQGGRGLKIARTFYCVKGRVSLCEISKFKEFLRSKESFIQNERMTGRAPRPCLWCGTYVQNHVCAKKPVLPALPATPVRRGGRRCTICRSLTHDRRTCVHPRAVELRRQREIALQHRVTESETEVELELEPEVRVQRDEVKLLADDQSFVLRGTFLYLEQKGPYGKELFLLEENVYDVSAVTATYSKDERKHLLKCTDEGVIIEPQSADDCPICMEPCYARYVLKNNLPCGHQVCLNCLPKLRNCDKCPLCRAEL